MDYWTSNATIANSSSLPAHLTDAAEEEQQPNNGLFRAAHHASLNTQMLFDDLPAPSSTQQDIGSSAAAAAANSSYGLYGSDDQVDVYRRLHQQQQHQKTRNITQPTTTNTNHYHQRNGPYIQQQQQPLPSSNLLLPSSHHQQQQIQIPVGSQSISIQVDGNPIASSAGGVRRDHTIAVAAQQALRQAASELATTTAPSATKGTRRWLMPLVIMFALCMAVALALASISLFGNQKDLRDRLAFQESQLKRMEEHMQQQKSSPQQQSKRDNLGIFNHESNTGEDDSSATIREPYRLHEQIYEFTLPQQQALPRAGEMIQVPSAENGGSVPGLDIETVVSYDVCCRLDDDSFSCARGMDVSRTVPSMSATLQRQGERQFLALRISTTAGYAGKQCILRFLQR